MATSTWKDSKTSVLRTDRCSKTLLAIAGPTGSGKTEISILLAQKYGCPVVNCDSRQIYKELPIGTAAPTAEERQQAKHYFVGTHTLTEDYNAGQYERDAVALLTTLMQQTTANPFAILSGGSMMYMDAVCYGLDDIPSVPAGTREQVLNEYRSNGLEWLQQAVKKADPLYFRTMADPQNPQRLLHALEITRHTGLPYSSFRKQTATTYRQRPWRLVKIGLDIPRDILYQRINQRVDKMLEKGLVEEARQATEPWITKDTTAMPNSLRTVGYNELTACFRGEYTLAQAIVKIKQNSRRYAKRQLTWLRRQTDIHWINRLLPDETIIQQIDRLI